MNAPVQSNHLKRHALRGKSVRTPTLIHGEVMAFALLPVATDVRPKIAWCGLPAEPALDAGAPWFFLQECFEAGFVLCDLHGCRAETIEYCGIHNGRHVWLART